MARLTITRRRAFTLAELAVSMAVSVVLLGGLASALVITTHAMPDRNSPSRGLLDASSAVEEIASDLLMAQSFNELGLTAVEFTVADRNHGAAGSEKIRYAWDGAAGAPLTRQYNGGTVASILDDVGEFTLTYDLQSLTEVGAPTGGGEFGFREIAYYALDSAAAEQEYPVSTDTWCGEFISPDPSGLPEGTVDWRLDNMYFRLMSLGKGSQSGNITVVQLRTANADRTPGATVIDELLVDEGTLDSRNWTMIYWAPTGAPWIGPTDGLCLVLKPQSQPDTCRVLYQTTAIPSGNVSFLQSSNGGTSYTVHNSQTMTEFFVDGTARTAGEGPTSTKSSLRCVKIGVRAGDSSSTLVETATEILNRPEVTAP